MGYRYIGTKTRVIEGITEAIREQIGRSGHVVDLMCGTGAATTAFRDSGYRVTANDVMTYSYHHARVALLVTGPPDFASARFEVCAEPSLFLPSRYESLLQYLGQLPSVYGYFFQELSSGGKPTNGASPRNYFTESNAARIDAMRVWIRGARARAELTDLEHSLLLHDLIMAANDVANIAGTYGHYLSHTVERALQPIRLCPTKLYPRRGDVGGHRVLQGYAEEVAAGLSCDLCYIDPPYMKRQYAANYHVIETLAREDEPAAIGVSGLRPWRDQYSNFCTKTKIRDSFRRVVRSMDCERYMISYSEDGLLGIGELTSLLSEFGDVTVKEFRHKRFRSNNSHLAPSLTEYLLSLRKNGRWMMSTSVSRH